MTIWLFAFGAALGSFINVVALRYDPDRFIFSPSRIGGRSHCPHCRTTLRWFELIPVVSFLLQRGRCRTCGAAISAQYPITEALCGMIFVFVPARLYSFYFGIPAENFYFLSAVWVAAFTALLLMSLIDLRLSIIPDEINVFLSVMGVLVLSSLKPGLSLAYGSFLRGYALLFYFPNTMWVNRLLGALSALVFFGCIIFITRGRGMGMGDMKLAFALGLLFGWPDIVLVAAMSFITGSVFGVYSILAGKKTMKSAVPFGPFLALGAAIIFFGGYELVRFYFTLFIA